MSMKTPSNTAFIVSAFCTLLAQGVLAAEPKSGTAAGGPVHCVGLNSCKGQGSCAVAKSSCNGPAGCATAGNACAGKNDCKGKGWVPTASGKECTSKGGTVAAK
jgi:hypothetical protein